MLKDYIYWADWNAGTVEAAEKHNGANRTQIHHQLDHVSDLQVFHMSRQVGWNPCAGDNGRCSHLCLARPGDPRHGPYCSCPTHYTLHNTTCSPPTMFLLYSQRNSINRLIWETDDCPDVPLPVQNLRNIRAIEYDPVSQFLYWVSVVALS